MVNIKYIILLNCILAFCFAIPVYSQLVFSKPVSHTVLDNCYLDTSLKITNLKSFSLSQRVFVLGEFHWLKGNKELEYCIFKELYNFAGVRVLALEIDVSYGYFINNYIETGDESILRMIHETAGLNYTNRYKELRSFYLSLPLDDKFSVVGISNENGEIQTMSPIYCIYQLICNHNLHPDLKYIKDGISIMLHANKLPNKKELVKLCTRIHEHIISKPDLFKTCLLKDYVLFNNVIEGTILGYNYTFNNLNDDNFKKRELFMYKTFCSINDQIPDQKILCITGKVHVNKKAGNWHIMKNWISFTTMLNRDKSSPFKGSVLSGIIYYTNYTKFENRLYNSRIFSKTQKKILGEIAANNDFKLIDICNYDSPFLDYCGQIDYIIVNDF